MKTTICSLFVLWMGGFAAALAQDTVTPPPQNYELPYKYRVAIEPRMAEVTNYVAVFGGVGLFEDSSAAKVSLDPFFPPPGLGDFNYNDRFSSTQLTLGVKVGILFPITDPASEDEVKFAFGGELEGFYNKFKTRGSVDADISLGSTVDTRVDADAAVFMVNGIGRMEYHFLRPYIGLGVGGAVINARTTTDIVSVPVTGSFRGDDLDLVFATQGLAGLEFKLTDMWALFAEYRHLLYLDPRFQEATHEVGWDYIQQGIVTGGLKFYY